MTERQIVRFFEMLADELPARVRIIVTGAAAAALWGAARPSLDIDFSVEWMPGSRREWAELERAIEAASKRAGIQTNFAADIDRWGQISLLDYRRHTQAYRVFGRLDVRLLDPAYWSIGKLTRYLEPDIRDLVAVLTRQQVPAGRAIRLWGTALRASPPSTASGLFRRQAEHFLATHGSSIWGTRFDAAAAVAQFRRLAGDPSGGSRA